MITQNQYNTFNVNYFRTESNLRYGQSFCNEFNITDSKLFYETNTSIAIDIIFKKYVDKGE